MLTLHTERLTIIPLDPECFQLQITDMGALERKLGLKVTGEALEDDVREAMEGLLKNALQDRENYWWHTDWQIILTEENRRIGGACFKGRPDGEGQVEVGYGMNPGYQGRGLMTEALREIAQWALKQPGVLSIIAETDKSNYASHRVLQKLGMTQFKETEEDLWWRISRQ